MRGRLRVAGALLGVAVLAGVVAASVWSPAALASTTVTCTTPVASGGCPDFVVPSGVSSITVTVWGAEGGSGGTAGTGCVPVSTGRLGGEVVATVPVAGGQIFHLYVGARGADGNCGGDGIGAGGSGGAGGNNDANGGAGGTGAGTASNDLGGGGGGGGESDIRLGGSGLANRVVVAGGGGGTGGSGGRGGAGGGDPTTPADPGANSGGGTAYHGGRGTASAGGIGGTGGSGTGGAGSDGSLGNGGDGGAANDTTNGAGGGGGGGGGLYGGGGAQAGSNADGGAGGGGGSGGVVSGYGATLVSATLGADAGNAGNGEIAITYANPPTTGAATQVTSTGATLNGTDSNGDTYHFEYGTDTSYGTSTPGATATGGTLSASVTGLAPGTLYHFRIVSSDAGPGNDQTFTTPAANLPVTGSATSITTRTATLQGTDPNSGESYHFEYGTTTSYGNSTPAATNGGGTLSAAITGLRVGTTYHFRIVSDSGAGSDATFTTLYVALTLPAGAVTRTSAKLKGLDPNAGSSYHFEYGRTTAYGHATPAASTPGNANTLVATIGGLTPGTKYHFRIVDSLTGPGRDSAFTTLSATGKRDLVLGLRGPATGGVGKPLRYVATIANKGKTTVTGAKLRLRFGGGGVKLVSAPGCTGGAGRLTCSLPKIATGHSVRVKVAVRPSKAGTLTVAGSLVTTFTDPTPKNNRATLHTTVA